MSLEEDEFKKKVEEVKTLLSEINITDQSYTIWDNIWWCVKVILIWTGIITIVLSVIQIMEWWLA